MGLRYLDRVTLPGSDFAATVSFFRLQSLVACSTGTGDTRCS
jgi:hypothetical protein